MNAFDHKLLSEIGALRDQAETLRKRLYDHHSVCACFPTAVCAFHATVNNHPAAIADAAEAAQTFILKEAA